MRVYDDKIYTIRKKDGYGEDVFRKDEDIVLMIPEEEYQICYDVTSVNRVTTTLKISWNDTDELYLVIPSVEKDEVLEKYHLNAGYSYFILHFMNEELVDFGGIEKETLETYYFQKSDFVSSKIDKPRILQAPIIALYTPGLYVKGLKELGYTSEYMINTLGDSGHFLETKPDYNLDITGNSTEVCRARTLEFLYYALKNFDIMHFHSNWSLMLGGDRLWDINADVGYLKKMGKKIVFSAWGLCDHTVRNEYEKWNWISECNRDICTDLRPCLCQNEKHCKRIERTRKYSSCMLTVGRGVIADKRMRWIDNSIDVDKYNPEIIENIPEEFQLPQSDKLRIYHSFGNMDKRDDVKGSKIVKAVVERLQQEGYPVEFIFFSNMNHSDLRYYQAQADIVIDQLYAGWYGSTGVESLALGKAMITYINPDVEGYVKNDLDRDIPILSATPESLYVVLKELIENKEKRIELGKRAREYAVKYHDYRVIAKQLSKIYGEIYKD